MTRCTAKTLSGSRCHRKSDETGTCWQHKAKSKPKKGKAKKTSTYLDSLTKTNNISGTSQKGIFNSSYSNLVKLLGEPHLGEEDAEKILAEWDFVDPKGRVFTIHDWKNYGKKKQTIREWHVGGNDDIDLNAIGKALGVKIRKSLF